MSKKNLLNLTEGINKQMHNFLRLKQCKSCPYSQEERALFKMHYKS